MPDHVDDRFEWDIAKSERTRRLRGFDLAFASCIFDTEPRQEFIDERGDYGEERVAAIGSVDGLLLVVVFTRRKGRIRIISARRARREHIDAYTQAFGHF